MCHCLSFLTHPCPSIYERWACWKRDFLHLIDRIISYNGPFSHLEVRRISIEGSLMTYCPSGTRVSVTVTMGNCLSSSSSSVKVNGPRPCNKVSGNGASSTACLFSLQGCKGCNQDAMIVCEGFGFQKDTVFCGVFDGHGPNGHLVAQAVRDTLPPKIEKNIKTMKSPSFHINRTYQEHAAGRKRLSPWEESFLNAFMLMDEELEGKRNIDCSFSGSTAVTLVKQGNDVIIGHVGDSRAVLATKSPDGSLRAVQLTVDLKPNVSREAERILRHKGRVFALPDEPDVYRVWLPNENTPGLAMTRAFGDFRLKHFGVISVPEVMHYQLTERDQFIVLATDGIWDVLSNEEVINIVSSVPVWPQAARAVVEIAVNTWRSKYPTSKVDDCAVVCLFTNDLRTRSKQFYNESTVSNPIQIEVGKHGSARATVCSEFHKTSQTEEWSALDGVTRVNSLVNLPRFSAV